MNAELYFQLLSSTKVHIIIIRYFNSVKLNSIKLILIYYYYYIYTAAYYSEFSNRYMGFKINPRSKERF